MPDEFKSLFRKGRTRADRKHRVRNVCVESTQSRTGSAWDSRRATGFDGLHSTLDRCHGYSRCPSFGGTGLLCCRTRRICAGEGTEGSVEVGSQEFKESVPVRAKEAKEDCD